MYVLERHELATTVKIYNFFLNTNIFRLKKKKCLLKINIKQTIVGLGLGRGKDDEMARKAYVLMLPHTGRVIGKTCCPPCSHTLHNS